jgi:hypothetical protein
LTLSYLILSNSILSYPILYPILPFPIVSCCILSYPVISCRILSYPFVSYPILSYRIVLYRIVSHRIVSYRIVSNRILSYPVIPIVSCRILSYPIVSFRILLYRIVSYPILSYPIVTCHILLYRFVSFWEQPKNISRILQLCSYPTCTLPTLIVQSEGFICRVLSPFLMSLQCTVTTAAWPGWGGGDIIGNSKHHIFEKKAVLGRYWLLLQGRQEGRLIYNLSYIKDIAQKKSYACDFNWGQGVLALPHFKTTSSIAVGHGRAVLGKGGGGGAAGCAEPVQYSVGYGGMGRGEGGWLGEEGLCRASTICAQLPLPPPPLSLLRPEVAHVCHNIWYVYLKNLSSRVSPGPWSATSPIGPTRPMFNMIGVQSW